MEKVRSPLKDKPLRNPAQSLDEEIAYLVDDVAVSYIVVTVLAGVLAMLEWIRWYMEQPYSPITYTVLAVIVLGVSLYKLFKIRAKLKLLKLGRDGEKAVGQYLELLRESGYRVFHDIVGDSFNIDHVVICEHGVFTIETKTYSKPVGGEAKILVNGKRLVINGFNNDDIAIQAKAEAGWLKELLLESTGRKVDVHPVVVFPGWYIDSKGADRDIWVLNPKALPTYIKNAPKVYTKEEVMLFTYHVSRYIRAG